MFETRRTIPETPWSHLAKRTPPQETPEARQKKVEDLKKKFKEGRLFQNLEENAAGLDRLLDDAFPEAKQKREE